MFISDFIAENLSIKFFRTPCMYYILNQNDANKILTRFDIVD